MNLRYRSALCSLLVSVFAISAAPAHAAKGGVNCDEALDRNGDLCSLEEDLCDAAGIDGMVCYERYVECTEQNWQQYRACMAGR